MDSRDAGLGPLILLGSVHGDPVGYERAQRFFAYLAPEVISVEISPFSVRYRERHGPRWRRRLESILAAFPPAAHRSLSVARLAAQLELPFEYRAARDWGKAHDIPVALVDVGTIARRHLPLYLRELLTPANVRLLWEAGEAATLAEYVAREFRRARLALEGKGLFWPGPADPEDLRREHLMARRLARLAASGKKVVHIGGWEHLVPSPGRGGLLRHLADFRPKIFLLDEADRL